MNSFTILAHAGHHHLEEGATRSAQPLIVTAAVLGIIILVAGIVGLNIWQRQRADRAGKAEKPAE